MKSVKYTLISLLLLFCTKGFSCWSPTYSPGEYYMFYTYDTEIRNPVSLNKTNIEEWRKLIKNQATIEDIKEVVYQYSICDMEKIATKKLSKGDSLYRNSFVRYLQKQNDKEIIDFLILAKRCEQDRSKRADKWWYPTKEDKSNLDLQIILDEALAYKGTRLKNRYLLQAIRAAYTMENYDLCLSLWEEQIKNLPHSAVKTMCKGYIGGIEFRKGDYEKAIQFYNDNNDQDSFWWCAKYLTKENSAIERIKILYKYQPSSRELEWLIQDFCRVAEENTNPKIFDNSYYSSNAEDMKRYMELRDFALQVAAEKRSDNPAMWQYTAAFLTFLNGKTALAMQYADKAATLQGTPFIKEKIKVLQIMLEVYAAKSYDAKFEKRFFPKLQWLDSLICRDINLKNRSFYDYEKDEWRNNMRSIKEEYNDWYAKNNYSQYYPFDMMRKIVLSVMLPKYVKQKEYTKALLLAGMASERLRSLSNFKHIEIDTFNNRVYKYHTDYSTDVFNYMDKFPVENVIEYQQLLQSGGRDEFEQFLASKCYKNDDYLNELIGTKYLRLEKFEDAIFYLSKVSNQYIKDMNVYEYFHLDPFREVYAKRDSHKPYPTYKLKYAKKMLALQQKIEREQNRERKAAAILQYAVALERSVSCYQSWALTTYYMSDFDDNYDGFYNDWQKNLLKRSEKLVEQAGKTIKNSKNVALQAKYDWSENVRYIYIDDYDLTHLSQSENETYRNFAGKYKDISTLQPFLTECDNFESYFVPQYINAKWAYNTITD